MAFVFNRHSCFSLERNATFCHFNPQSFLINRFKKSVAQLTMNLHRSTNDFVSLRVFVHFR